MNYARFTINGNASSNRGYDTTNGAALSFALEASSALVRKVEYWVSDATDPEAPLASKDAPELALVGTTTGRRVIAATPATAVTTTAAAGGVHSWIVRCLVNDGVNQDGSVNPDFVFERMVSIRTADGRRKIIGAEGTQYSLRGWADAQNEDVEALAANTLPVPALNRLLQGDGTQWQAVTGIDAARITSGGLVAERGGTGQSTWAKGDLLYASGATTLSKLAIGDAGEVLTSSGTAPQWAYVTSLRSAVTLQPQLVVGPDSTPDYPGQVAITDDGGVAVAMQWSGSQDSRTGEVVQLAETWEIEGETVPGQITGLTLQGVTLANTTLGRVYITVLDEGTDTTVEILDAPGGNVLASGTQSGKAGGALHLVEYMGSGVSGSITLAAGCQTDATPYATLTANAVATFSAAPVGELGRPFAGVMYTNGASDGGDVWVVVAGKAQVLTYAGAAAGSYLYIDTARAYPDSGKVDCELPRTTAYEDHGIGRALERVTSGLVLAQLDLRGFGPVQSA
jgi:hypothetical protein